MKNELDDLKDAYIAELPEKVQKIMIEIDKVSVQLKKNAAPNTAELLILVHKLAGSAGTYGLQPISVLARDLEDQIVAERVQLLYLEEWLKHFRAYVDYTILEARDKNGKMVA